MSAFLRKLLYAGLPVPRFVRPAIRAAYRAGVAVVECGAFMRKVLWIEPVLRSVCHSVGKGLRAERLPYMRGRGRLSFGDRVNLSGRSCFYFMSGLAGTPEIKVGNGTFIGNGCTFSAAKCIRVGDGCLVAAGARIHDNDGHPLAAARRASQDRIGEADAAEVTIGDNVWIGAGAVILKGVSVGDHCVVGASSVLTVSVPSRTIVAGNPARVVGAVPE